VRAICTDGTEIECENFKAVEGGVLLTTDKKRKTVFGFVPNTNLSYVLPDDVVPARAPETPAGESDETVSAERDPSADAALRITAGADGDAADTDDADHGTTTERDASGGDADDADDPVAGLVAGAPDATTIDPAEDLRRLAGLGDTYAARFREAGVETISDLRARSVDEVAAIASVPRGRAERWLRLVTVREDAGTDAGAAAESAVATDTSETEVSESR
jgi:predicted flap endonuclease-1-like 5' DNA nuclease